MGGFALPRDLKFNRGPVEDPQSFIETSGCSSWLLLTGDEFAGMRGGISFRQVQSSIEFHMDRGAAEFRKVRGSDRTLEH